jgi:hypothetical protein
VGEIKSTLELVLEKTKDLNLSKEEREQQKYNEIRLKVNGLLQKYQDRMIRKEKLKEEINSLRKTYSFKENTFLINEIIGRLNLDEDNCLILNLLKEVFGLNVKELESLFNDYQTTITSLTQKRINEVKETLSKKRFVSGSAVVPNLETDDAWRVKIEDIKNKFQQKLYQQKSKWK